MQRFSELLVLPTLLVSVGCKKVDEAPKEYETAVAYLFENFTEEDPAGLVDTIDFLDDWLQGSDLESAEEGLSIQNLPGSAVRNLSGHAHGTDGL